MQCKYGDTDHCGCISVTPHACDTESVKEKLHCSFFLSPCCCRINFRGDRSFRTTLGGVGDASCRGTMTEQIVLRSSESHWLMNTNISIGKSKLVVSFSFQLSTNFALFAELHMVSILKRTSRLLSWDLCARELYPLVPHNMQIWCKLH